MEFNNCKYIIVGAGLFGSVMAERIANILHENVIVLEKRNHIGGNCFSEIDKSTGIEYHKYGTHIFHTSNQKVWDYIKLFTEFNNYFHQVLTTYKNRVYQMPINLETINSFYNINLKPFEVEDFILKESKAEGITNSKNFEEKAITLIGRPLYEAFIKGYTLKQWQKDPKELPAEILTRLPFRNNYYESYFDDKWQGIPLEGYSKMFERMLSNENIEVICNIDFFDVKDIIDTDALIIYSGPIDRYFGKKFGSLEWRTIQFENEIKNVMDYQGTSVMNYGEIDIPYTRIHEPKHLHRERKETFNLDKTLIITEYSKFDDGANPYYPINDKKNRKKLKMYKELASNEKNVLFSGRLGSYKYFDMHHTIEIALENFNDKILNNRK